MTDLDRLGEAARKRHYIAPELILAAYQGMHVDKIEGQYLARVDDTNLPHFLLDEKMRLSGVLYGKWDEEKYILLTREDGGYGTFLFPRRTDASGQEIIPDGWWTEDDENFSAQLFLEEEGLL